MGKKQVRAQMRKVKPKAPAAAAVTQGTTRRQRERYVQAGGLLQGYAPDFVVRLGYIAVGVGVALTIPCSSNAPMSHPVPGPCGSGRGSPR